MSNDMHIDVQENIRDSRPTISDSELFGLLSNIDLLEVTATELDKFDDSTFETSGKQLPARVASPERMLRKLNHAQQQAEIAEDHAADHQGGLDRRASN